MNNPLEQFLHWEKTIPDNLFLRQPFNGHWKTYTYKEAGNEIRRIAAGLHGLNLSPKSHVALLSKNCAHWIMADLAIMLCGHISIPLYATLTAPSIQQILEHADAKAIIIGKLDQYEEQQAGIPSGMVRIGIEAYGIQEEITWEKWLAHAPTAHAYSWQPTDIFTIIYTSGTTGKAKGVMHEMNAVDATVKAAFKDLDFALHPVLFSFLPLSHIAERIGIEMVGLYLGAQYSFSESLNSFADNLKETQPHIFFAVPRLWAKFREKVLEKLPQKKLDTLLRLPIIGGIIKKKIRKNLGLSRATHIFSGAAPISVEMLEWFEKLDVVILQAYGMTEDFVYGHFNRNDANKHGTVGKPLTGLSVKISSEGEIRLKSAGNLRGYYKEPELTAAAFDEEHYLRTGDLGEIDTQGFLKITGRLKDQFKTDKGKYISPAPIEMQLLKNTDIEQVCVVGMGIPQPIALIVASAAGKSKSKETLYKSIADTLNEINPGLESYEKIEKAVLLKDDWTIENGLLTPTLKVKRNEVEKIHLPKYPLWYAQEGVVIVEIS
ncbi:MAG: AMP-dependent synthetase [Cytophaga sp.]|nr:AMP-dependent synthetase [Cytophaga sp.]